MRLNGIRGPIIFAILMLVSLWTPVVSAKDIVSSGDVYEISAKVEQAKNGKMIVLQIRPKGNVHCNLEYPWKVKLVPNGSLAESTQTTWRKADAKSLSREFVEFNIPIPRELRQKKVLLEVKLSMCDDKQCYMKKVTLSI